jgi:serine protease Do
MKWKQRNVLGYLTLVVALAVLVGSITALAQMNGNATAAEAVKVNEGATVVESPFTQAVKSVRDSVVGVNNYGQSSPNNFPYWFGRGYGERIAPDEEERDDRREVLQGSGSGVVIAPGYVVTNYHVVEDADSLEITVAEETHEATLMGYDEALDIAVLKADGLNLQPVTLGDSDLLNVGDWAICIGNPLSFTGTTTVGIISALNREVKNSTTDIYGRRTENTNAMIQTDAAINAGNSGGGMFNVAGELVGIPSLKYTGSYYSSSTVEGIGMAIPINVVKPLINDVLSGKTVGNIATPQEEGGANNAIAAPAGPRIGVTVGDMNTSNPAVASGILPMGAYVSEIEKGSPAEKAGLLVGDIIVQVDDTVITSTQQMVSILRAKKAGETAAIRAYRVEGIATIENYEDIPDGQYMDFQVELAMLDNVRQ